MEVSDNLTRFFDKLSQREIDIVKSFLSDEVSIDKMKHGEKALLKDNISVVYLAIEGSFDYENILEAHKKFYDLHVTLEGADRVAYKKLSDCHIVKSIYSEENDFMLFNEKPKNFLEVPFGSFCFIEPSYAHMALYGDCGFIRKLVFKIPVRE